MQYKKYEDLIRSINKYSIDEPLVVVVYGKDIQVFNFISEYVEKEKYKHVPVEVSVLTGEQEDAGIFINDLYNFTLFIPHRLYVIKQAQVVFKNLKNTAIKEIPPKTWVLVEYEGDFPKKLFSIPENQLFLYETRILYDNQIDEFIRSLAKELNLVLSEEAINEMKLLFPPKESILRTAILNIEKIVKTTKEQQEPYYITYEDIRTIFYPSGGWDVFKIIEACFDRDLITFLVEIEKYNPPEDNYYNLLKNLLNKTDEIRKYLIGKRLNFDHKEMIKILKAEKKHPFIQKKLLAQLEEYSKFYTIEKLEKIYHFLVDIAFSFRQNIDDHQKKVLFVKRSIEVFFS
ncbi:MAG: hypothetical protein NZ853_01965 [Leptospiraceae bacterium]|nr:hypothetical protein [Leptospiraceae bacterium]MDW7976008.1 hypothetical protein [Leptospiraceae bacterium]